MSDNDFPGTGMTVTVTLDDGRSFSAPGVILAKCIAEAEHFLGGKDAAVSVIGALREAAEKSKPREPPKVYLAVRSSPETVGGGHECRTFATFNAAKEWGVGPWAEDLNVYCVELSDDVDWAGVELIYHAEKWSP